MGTAQEPRSFWEPGAKPRQGRAVMSRSSAPTGEFPFPRSKKTALARASAMTPVRPNGQAGKAMTLVRSKTPPPPCRSKNSQNAHSSLTPVRQFGCNSGCQCGNLAKTFGRQFGAFYDQKKVRNRDHAPFFSPTSPHPISPLSPRSNSLIPPVAPRPNPLRTPQTNPPLYRSQVPKVGQLVQFSRASTI